MEFAGRRPSRTLPQDAHNVYDYQQAQLEYQLRQMQLKNLEMQSALLVQAQAAVGQPQYTWPGPARLEDDRARRDAVQTLERAQRHRFASANGSLSGIEMPNDVYQPDRRGARLSFGGGDGFNLAEHARARHSRHQSVDAPPVFAPTYEMSSGGARPTLVLSKPGEAFPETVTRQPMQVARSFGHHGKSDSHSSSSSSTSDRSSTGSEPGSFDSVATSVGSPLMTATYDNSHVHSNKLNPSAMTFMPTNGIAPPLFVSTTPPPRMPRFSSPQISSTLAVATRQPRGPARDEDFDAQNFASRIRRKAIVSLQKSRQPNDE